MPYGRQRQDNPNLHMKAPQLSINVEGDKSMRETFGWFLSSGNCMYAMKLCGCLNCVLEVVRVRMYARIGGILV